MSSASASTTRSSISAATRCPPCGRSPRSTPRWTLTSRCARCSTHRRCEASASSWARTDNTDEVVPVEVFQDGPGVPLCCVHDGLGLSWSYRTLGGYLDGPIIGINQVAQDGEAEPDSIRAMAARYADRLQTVYPTGPYKILGWSFGGVVAHELAVELRRRGCEVQRLVLLDPAFSASLIIVPSEQGSSMKVRSLNTPAHQPDPHSAAVGSTDLRAGRGTDPRPIGRWSSRCRRNSWWTSWFAASMPISAISADTYPMCSTATWSSSPPHGAH